MASANADDDKFPVFINDDSKHGWVHGRIQAGQRSLSRKTASELCDDAFPSVWLTSDDSDALLSTTDFNSITRDESDVSSSTGITPSIYCEIQISPNLDGMLRLCDADGHSNGPYIKAQRKGIPIGQRNPEVERFMNQVDIYDPDGLNLHTKVVVELADGDFLQIILILQSRISGEVLLRGHKFRRTRYMNGMFDNKLNEVCWIQELDKDDRRPAEIQSMTTISIGQVVKRRGLRFTNQAYPALNFRNDRGWVVPSNNHPEKQKLYQNIEDNAPLTCRMKFVRWFKNAEARLRDESHENAVIFLCQNECDAGLDNKICDLQLRQMWRGETVFGGAQARWEPGEKEFLRQEALSHAGQQCHNSLVISGRQYEAGDVMTRGTVGDLLIRDDEIGVFYQKLSGVNDTCFVRSTLNVVTGEEFQYPQANNKGLKRKISNSLRGSIDAGGAFYMNDERRRLDSRPSSARTGEVIEIDTHWEKTTDNLVHEQRVEGKLTVETSLYVRKPQKCNNTDAFPLAHDLGRTRAPSLCQREESKFPADPDKPAAPFAGFHPLSRGKFCSQNPVPNRLTKQWSPVSADGSVPLLPTVTAPDSPNSSSRSTNTVPPRAKTKPTHRRYTFGDCFCGAGGMSRAAVMAGLRVKWGFDFNDLACYTYALNFHTARVYHEDAHIFATSRADQKVDICHMSPPCQYFSPAHTHAGKNDDANTASFFAVGQLLHKTRCRIAILEQTAGLLNRHEQYFHACVREFTQHAFSVRWKLINGADFGLAQRRTRLFMIASCPGEPLPPFPLPTHHPHPSPTQHPDIKPWTTINQALHHIPPLWPDHSPHLMPPRNEPQPPGAGDKVANCITTSGGENTVHPSGTRSYTHRELACLQGFPLGHKFGGVEVRRQIGNAVAPVVGARVLKRVVEWLGERDRWETEGGREVEG